MLSDEALATKLAVVLPHLDERQRRIVVGAEARALGRGGVTRVARAAGMARSTVHAAAKQIDEGVEVSERVRRPGGGRKRLTETDPGLGAALDALVDPDSRGDPQSPLRWTSKSTRHLARTLTAAGHPVSHVVVGELLKQLGYTLQGAAKTREGRQHPDRDAQFGYLNNQVKDHQRSGDPVISVDTKKKELSVNRPLGPGLRKDG